MASGPLNPIVPPQRPQQPKPQWSNKSVAIMIVGAVTTMISVMVIVSRLNTPQPQASTPSEPTRAADSPRRDEPVRPRPAPTPKSGSEVIRDRLRALSNYSARDAFKKIGPSDAADDDDENAMLFGLWLIDRGVWEDVQPAADEKTSYGLVMKDANKERGKRLCASGTIMQIRVDSSSSLGTETFGLLLGRDMNVYRFVAVHDTGELVANSPAKFCGFVAGKTAFSNVSGGETQGVYMVGMFDLPSNRAMKRKPAAL